MGLDEGPRVAAAALVFLGAASLLLQQRLPPQRVRRYGVRPLNRDRKVKGQFITLFKQMKMSDAEQFFIYTKMTIPFFDDLLNMCRAQLSKKSRNSICPEERLAITLHYLSQGVSQQAAAWSYKLGKATVHHIIMHTCNVLWEVLSPKFVKAPKSEEEWLQIAQEFEQVWNFPHCIGAIDGKHVTIQAPGNSGSQYFNYKKQFSIVLMAVCDARYCFKLVDIGAYGSASDGGVLRGSVFGQALYKRQLNVPPLSILEGTTWDLPYCLVGDEAFPLNEFIMRPFPGANLDECKRIFNYRLSRARRTIENAFGILVARWRILKHAIPCKVENVEHILKACIALHNYVKSSEDQIGVNRYCPAGYTEGEIWRRDIEPLRSVGRLAANNMRRNIYNIRNNLAMYLTSAAGEMPHQYRHVNRGQLP